MSLNNFAFIAKKTTKIIFFSCFIIGFCINLFISCKFSGSTQTEPNDGYATVYFSILNNEPVSAYRTASPILPAEITYTLTATGTETGKTTVTTKKSDDDSQEDPSFIAEKKYMLKLPAGTWTVSADGRDNDNQKILAGTSEEFTVAANGIYSKNIKVYFYSSEGKGSSDLYIETTGTNIAYLQVSGTGQAYLDKRFDVETSGGKKSIHIFTDSFNVPSGNYHPTLTFYNANNTIVTVIKETFNIRQNRPTDTWFKTGNALYLKEKADSTNGESDFILTNEIIDSIENNTFYVKGSNATSDIITGTGRDTNDGTRVAPYLSLVKAINRINELNNVNYSANENNANEHSLKSFTIFCDGEIGNINTSSAVTIVPEHNLNLTVESIDTVNPAKIISPNLTFGSDTTNNIYIGNLTLAGNITLQNGNIILDSVSVIQLNTNSTYSNTGKLSYSGGQLTLSGATGFINGISLDAVSKRILLGSSLTAPENNSAKIRIIDGTASYTENNVIIEGAGSTSIGVYNDVTAADLERFMWENPVTLSGNTVYYALRLKTFDTRTKAILGKTPASASNLPVWNDISFILEGYDITGSSLTSTPPHYEYKISGHGNSTDKITGSMTLKLSVKKGRQKLLLGNNELADSSAILDSISLTLYSDTNTPLAPTEAAPCTTETVTDSAGDYTRAVLTASGIRPGVYTLKMSAVIDGIPYSQHSAAIYASLGAQ